jgi:hypothetical protein
MEPFLAHNIKTPAPETTYTQFQLEKATAVIAGSAIQHFRPSRKTRPRPESSAIRQEGTAHASHTAQPYSVVARHQGTGIPTGVP